MKITRFLVIGATFIGAYYLYSITSKKSIDQLAEDVYNGKNPNVKNLTTEQQLKINLSNSKKLGDELINNTYGGLIDLPAIVKGWFSSK